MTHCGPGGGTRRWRGAEKCFGGNSYSLDSRKTQLCSEILNEPLSSFTSADSTLLSGTILPLQILLQRQAAVFVQHPAAQTFLKLLHKPSDPEQLLPAAPRRAHYFCTTHTRIAHKSHLTGILAVCEPFLNLCLRRFGPKINIQINRKLKETSELRLRSLNAQEGDENELNSPTSQAQLADSQLPSSHVRHTH